MTAEELIEIYENEGQEGVEQAIEFSNSYDVWEEECEL